MFSTFSLQAAGAGTLAAFVGFASSFAILIQGFMVAGASRAEAASGLMAVCVLMGLAAVWVALRTRMPISIAWSTPGAVLLIASGPLPGGFPTAVGAFVVAGVLVVLAGMWRPLGRWVASIPAPLANAMLAGVLLNLCLAPVRAVAELPVAALVIVGTWAIVGRFRRLLAVPAAVLAAAVVISLTVIKLTSSPSIATIRSPGEIRSTRALLDRTPETTVPRASALLARMIPSRPAGA